MLFWGGRKDSSSKLSITESFQQLKFLMKCSPLIQGNSILFHPEPEETVSNVCLSITRLPTSWHWIIKGRSHRRCFSVEIKTSGRAPKAQDIERMQINNPSRPELMTRFQQGQQYFPNLVLFPGSKQPSQEVCLCCECK